MHLSAENQRYLKRLREINPRAAAALETGAVQITMSADEYKLVNRADLGFHHLSTGALVLGGFHLHPNTCVIEVSKP